MYVCAQNVCMHIHEHVCMQIMKEYKNEINDILLSNKQLAKELQYDLRQYEKAQADKDNITPNRCEMAVYVCVCIYIYIWKYEKAKAEQENLTPNRSEMAVYVCV